MRIVSLKAENFKRLVAVQINPTGNVVQITGRNGEGKTSVLDTIWSALAGGRSIPDKPIREGAEVGTIEIDLGDMIVKRRFTAKGSYLSVENKDGAVFKSPQSILDNLIGRLSFDPMEFMRMKPKDQFDALAAQAGLDFAPIEADRKGIYDERTLVNREVAQKQAELASFVLPDDVPTEPVDVNTLVLEISNGIAVNQSVESAQRGAQEQAEIVVRLEEKIETMRQTMAVMEEQLAGEKDSLLGAMRFAESVKLQAVDVPALQAKLADAERHNELVRSHQQSLELQAKIAEKEALAKRMTQELGEIEQRKADMIADSALPVEGLGFGDGVVTYNGVPLNQASSAEQLRVSVAIAMAANPKLRVIRIQDGSWLDSRSMKLIEELAASGDYQFWIERVDESGKVGIVIEDGHVAAIDGEPVQDLAETA